MRFRQLFSKSPEARLWSNFSTARICQHIEQRQHGENVPEKLLVESTRQLSKLSRIFDNFIYPVPDYSSIKAQVAKHGLDKYIQKLLDNVLPNLLDESGEKLHPNIIQAINRLGLSLNPQRLFLYGDITSKYSDKQIADQFVKSFVTSFGQRVLDKVKEESIAIKNNDQNQIIRDFGSVSTPEKQSERKNKLKEAADDDVKRQNDFFVEFTTPLGRVAEELTSKGTAISIKLESFEDAKNFFKAFDELVKQAKTKGIIIPGIVAAQEQLKTARQIINDEDLYLGTPGASSIVRTGLYQASKIITEAMANGSEIPAIRNNLVKPESRGFFKRLFNLFKPFEDEKLYTEQLKILDKLEEMYKQTSEELGRDNASDAQPERGAQL